MVFVGSCLICECLIAESDPRIEKSKKLICSSCYIDLIEDIYSMAGFGDGGIIHLAFRSCLESTHNRKNRRSLKQNRKLWAKLAYKYKFSCVFCGDKDNLTIDHIKPVSKGGSDEFSNLQVLCKSCNSKKGAKW